jgi:archaellum component FlaG (FlaF/FlaG flagellin family)
MANPMNINSTATSILVIWYIAGSLISISVIATMSIVLVKLSKRLESLEHKISPLIDQTSEVLRTINKTVIQAEPGITTILSNVETTTASIAQTSEIVATTTNKIISNPLGEVSAIKDAVLSMTKRNR